MRLRMSPIGCVLSALALTSCISLPKLFNRGDGDLVKTANGDCVNLTPESKLHAVAACDSSDVYEVVAPGRHWRMAGGTFRKLLRERLMQFVVRSNYPWKTLSDGQIVVFIVAPTFAPERAYFVAEVTGSQGNFAVPLDLMPDRWMIDDDTVLWLGKEAYPTSKAKRAGVLQLSGRNHLRRGALMQFVDASGVSTLLTASGGKAVRSVTDGGQVVVLKTAPFAELAVASRLTAQPSAPFHIQQVELVPAGEPEGSRAAIFRFPFRQ